MDILLAVVSRLEALGYPAINTDSNTFDYYIKKAEAYLKANTNQQEVPEGLFYVWVDMAAGYFLADKKTAGALSEIYDFDAPAKSVSMGDTSVALADGATFESQFDNMLAKMVNPDMDMILAFRRLAW